MRRGVAGNGGLQLRQAKGETLHLLSQHQNLGVGISGGTGTSRGASTTRGGGAWVGLGRSWSCNLRRGRISCSHILLSL